MFHAIGFIITTFCQMQNMDEVHSKKGDGVTCMGPLVMEGSLLDIESSCILHRLGPIFKPFMSLPEALDGPAVNKIMKKRLLLKQDASVARSQEFAKEGAKSVGKLTKRRATIGWRRSVQENFGRKCFPDLWTWHFPGLAYLTFTACVNLAEQVPLRDSEPSPKLFDSGIDSCLCNLGVRLVY
ncbi:hypothetical protein HOLleu_10429 [Holothuria leucospilota]|uniref:Uncharacterized protein n=1 Tax=Holothuria leucospilota TaxID=206669 RepID=A0A9Q1CE31_HOLLE|nr:hypothetical protein HOLleu_10429 [Holothuria leucospilota]